MTDNASGQIVTRFAPSPTGYLHVGGARTALFNWAYARHLGGRFILRIEDTDQLRSSEESTRKIVQDLAWLGIDWDEGPDPKAANPYATQLGEHGPYFQSQRLEIYRQYVQQLLDRKLAYEAFESSAELAARREASIKATGSYYYDPTEALSLTPDQIRKFKDEGRPYVVRFRVPDKKFVVEDQVLGRVEIGRPEIEDFVIWKADGFPTYHFAVVVDDILMGVTDVLRGQEHLMNTPKHIALYEALEVTPPRYAHLPLIFNPDGSKMSKRDKAKAAREAARKWLAEHGNDHSGLAAAAEITEPELEGFLKKKSDDNQIAASVARVTATHLPEIDIHDFRASGYLPEALVCYLALLGWSPKNDLEEIDLNVLANRFDIGGIHRSAARFDRSKLLAFNADAIRRLPADEFGSRLQDYLAEFYPEYVQRLSRDQFHHFAIAYKVRARTLAEPAEAGRFFVADDAGISYDNAAAKKALRAHENEGLQILKALVPELQRIEPWSVENIEARMAETMQSLDANLGKVGQPLRVAVSGGAVTPPLYETLVVLGKERVLGRVERCLRAFAADQRR